MGASLGTGNKGVSALCASFVKIVNILKPEAKVKLFIGNRSAEPQQLQLADKNISLEVINYRLSPKAKLEKNLMWIFFLACLQRLVVIPYLKKQIIQRNPCLNEIIQSNFVGDIRGGDSFSDIYGVKDFLIASIPALIVLLLGKKLVLLPQTIGPFDAYVTRKLAAYIISKSHRVCSRDLASIEYVNNHLINNISISSPLMFCPDVAFLLDSIMPDNVDIRPLISAGNALPVIGINVNGLMYNGGYTGKNMFGLKADYKQMMLQLIETLLNETDAELLLIPHTFGPPGGVNSDPDASQKLLNSVDERLRTRVHMVMSEHDQSGMKGIIGLCDFFIGSRMHACIAALSQHIPTVGIAYSKKFSGVFESIGSEDTVLDARTLSDTDIVKKIVALYKRRDTLRDDAEVKIAAAQSQVVSAFTQLITTK